MQLDQETLQQALLEVEHLRQLEARSRHNAESLLEGLERLSSAHSQKDSVLAILSVLSSVIDVDDAIVLCEVEPGHVISLAETSAHIHVADGTPKQSLARALKGKSVVLSNAGSSGWADGLDESSFNEYASVAMVPVSPVDFPTLIICLGKEPAKYSKSDLERLKYFIPLAAHAIRHSFKLAELRRVVSELNEARSAAEASARSDPLTGLSNRMHLEEHFASVLKQGLPCSFGLIDLNGFKPINDNFGHHAGDLVLIEIGRRLTEQIGKDAFVARIGGDEFAVLSTDATDAAAMEKLGAAICGIFRDPVPFEEREFEVGASVGLARAGKDDASAESLLLEADAAMYAVKSQRKTGYLISTAETSVDQRKIINARTLADAIEANQIVPYYQPQFDMKTRQPVGLEVLARWEHPIHGLIMPGEFIVEIERGGLSDRFTSRMLTTALDQARLWDQKGLLVPDMSVNLLQANLTSFSAMEGLLGILLEHPAMFGKVIFEITESVFFGRSSAHIASTLKEVEVAGARISLDDFGTGFASLASLAQVQFHELKIDRDFVSGIRKGRQKEAIIEAILTIAKAHGARVVAEGIEEQHQYDFLADLGCDLVQGYLLGRPASAATTTDLLELHSPREQHKAI